MFFFVCFCFCFFFLFFFLIVFFFVIMSYFLFCEHFKQKFRKYVNIFAGMSESCDVFELSRLKNFFCDFRSWSTTEAKLFVQVSSPLAVMPEWFFNFLLILTKCSSNWSIFTNGSSNWGISKLYINSWRRNCWEQIGSRCLEPRRYQQVQV